MIKTYLLIILLIVSNSLLAQDSKMNIEHQRPTAQWEVLEPSFDTKDIDSLTYLIKANNDSRVRKRACELMGLALERGAKGDKRLISTLIERWDKESDEDVKIAILGVLYSISKKDKDRRILSIAIKSFRSLPSTNWGKVTAIQIINYFSGDKVVEEELLLRQINM
jgi:hypothetical protein